MVWYSHLLKNFPQFVVIHTVKGFGIINEAEVDTLEFSWKQIEIILSFLRLHPSTAFQTLLLTVMVTPFLLRDSCPQ